MKRTLLSFAAAAMLIAGCGAQPGKSVVTLDYQGPTHKIEAPMAGTYSLYKKSALNPDLTYELKKGDSLGFEAKDGKLYGVAGSHEDELAAPGWMGGYYWKMKTATMAE